MKLLTKEILKKFEQVGSQEGKGLESIVVAKFFFGPATWYAIEYNPELKEFWGWANLGDDQCAEYGYFSLRELESLKNMFGLGVERDLYCGYQTLAEHLN